MRDITLKIRCSSEERDLFEQARKDADFNSVSGWLRSLAYEASCSGNDIGNICQGLADVKRELSSIGNNLNQLTKNHNSGQVVDVAQELNEVRDIIKILSQKITGIRPNPYLKRKGDAD